MVRISASHLPADLRVKEQVVVQRDDVEVVAAVLDAAQIDSVCSALLVARGRLLDMPVSRVIRAIDAAAQCLSDPAESERTAVLRSLTAITGMSAAMAGHVLDRIAADWRASALEQLLRDELGGPAAIESFVHQPGGSRRARVVAPPLGLHVFSGNVPGIGVTSIVRALLVRSAVLAKTAAGEPALTPAFARLLARADPEVGSCVAVTYWRGGERHLEDAALARANLLVHYGGAGSIAALRARAPAHVRVVEHGPRISFALIDATGAAPIDRAPTDLAAAVALFDQQGCVSPQLAWVIGDADAASHLARATADALERIQHDLPRGRIDAAEAVAIRELRTRAEFAGIAGRRTQVWGPADLLYSVILSDETSFEGTCLNRTLLVKHVPDLETLLEVITPYSAALQTVGVAGFASDTIEQLAARLGEAGVSRVAPIADMPWPPPAWHHDGRGPLRELISWIDLEGEIFRAENRG